MIYEYQWYARDEDDREFKLTFEVEYDISGNYINIDDFRLIAIDDNYNVDKELEDYWTDRFVQSHDVFDMKQEIGDYLETFKEEI